MLFASKQRDDRIRDAIKAVSAKIQEISQENEDWVPNATAVSDMIAAVMRHGELALKCDVGDLGKNEAVGNYTMFDFLRLSRNAASY